MPIGAGKRVMVTNGDKGRITNREALEGGLTLGKREGTFSLILIGQREGLAVFYLVLFLFPF